MRGGRWFFGLNPDSQKPSQAEKRRRNDGSPEMPKPRRTTGCPGAGLVERTRCAVRRAVPVLPPVRVNAGNRVLAPRLREGL